MKQLDLPFRIDMQFDNWEFDLDFYKTHNADNRYQYKIYYYLKSEVDVKIFLAFNCDFLAGFFYIYNNVNLPAKGNYNKSIKFIKFSNCIIQLKTKRNWKISEEELVKLFDLN